MKKYDKIIVEQGEDKVFENATCIAVPSNNIKNKLLLGTYVVIPKSQVSTPFEMSENEWLDTRELMMQVQQYINQKYNPDGYNIGWNVGKAGGQSVAHAHMHILPRYNDEVMTGKGIRYLLKHENNYRTSLQSENQIKDMFEDK